MKTYGTTDYEFMTSSWGSNASEVTTKRRYTNLLLLLLLLLLL